MPTHADGLSRNGPAPMAGLGRKDTSVIHRLFKTALGGLVIALVLVACQEGPGSHTHDTSHTHDPTSIAFTKAITLSSTSFSVSGTSGTVAKAFYSMPEITAKAVAGGLVEAYMDLDSGGSAWVPLPDTIQFSDLVVSTVSYLYRQGMFEVLVTSPDPSTVAGTVLAINGYRVKVVILSAP